MLRRTAYAALLLALLTGLSLAPARAEDDDRLQRLLEITGLPAEQTGDIGGQLVTLKARLDRGQLVYGLPTDIPNNDWKPAETSWEADNGISLGHPGNQEPRYLGKACDWSDFTNDWFPPDAPNQVAPAQRDMVESPWDKGYCEAQGSFSDYTWGLIRKALATYHYRLGFQYPEDGFAYNPAFRRDFDAVRDYFKVLAEPRPGLTGAVHHWHYRADLGGVWYDTISIRWSVIPDFAVESVDPGTEKAEPGKTYTGRAVLKARADGSFLDDPVNRALFETLGGEVELTQDYVVPVGVAVNGQLVPLKNLEPVPGLENVYWWPVKAGKAEDSLEVQFDWTAGTEPVTVSAAVNTTLENVLPYEVWQVMEWSELTSINNVQKVQVPVDVANLYVRNLTLDPNPASPGDAVAARAEIVNEGSQDVTTVARWIFNDQVVSEQEVWIPAGGYNVTQAQISAPDEPGTYAVGILANPNRDRPANEKTWDDNYAEGYLEVRRLASPGSDGLTLQAWSHPGTDLYGEWQPARKRPVNTAKWSDDVRATLRVARPVPPRGRLDWWEISSAKLTYPRQNPDFTFGCPYPPSGTVTVNMKLPGRAGPETEWLEATAEFEENWAMDGFPVYCMLEERQMTTERPKSYPVTATYTVRYQYTYVVCGKDGCDSITATDSYTRTARQDLLVNGAGTVLYGN